MCGSFGPDDEKLEADLKEFKGQHDCPYASFTFYQQISCDRPTEGNLAMRIRTKIDGFISFYITL